METWIRHNYDGQGVIRCGFQNRHQRTITLRSPLESVSLRLVLIASGPSPQHRHPSERILLEEMPSCNWILICVNLHIWRTLYGSAVDINQRSFPAVTPLLEPFPAQETEDITVALFLSHFDFYFSHNNHIHIGWFLSQAPTIVMLFGKTLPGLLELHFFGNSTLTWSNSLWHFYTPRFFFCWTMVRWWSQRLRENDRWRPITFEALNGIVVEGVISINSVRAII